MSQRAKNRRRHSDKPLIVTPLIDVVMVLIIFYLMVGAFVSGDYEDMLLPLAVYGDDVSGGAVYTVNVLTRPGEDGVDRPAIIVQGRPTSVAELTGDVRALLLREPGTVVQLRAARDLPYGSVEPAVRALAQAGVREMRLVTESAR
ncbi:MAG: biopolymer transporter ExbD [Phycisphaerales bacterium]|nr:MAG: biopolymer transporter ExbD [Phycisphaerales bacterium]